MMSSARPNNSDFFFNCNNNEATVEHPIVNISHPDPYEKLKPKDINTPITHKTETSSKVVSDIVNMTGSPSYSSFPCMIPSLIIPTIKIGPYDIVELRAISSHAVKRNREALRIVAVAAGENLYNLYRVLMASLCQREDRARLVFHAWILPDGSLYGNGSRGRESNIVFKFLKNDREVYLNHLPIYIGYQLQLVFGKCVYQVIVQDLLIGMNDEQDLIWTPRVCEGSYGEAVPFDLCYSPHLFRSRTPEKQKPRISDKGAEKENVVQGTRGDSVENSLDDEIEKNHEKRCESLSPNRDDVSCLRPRYKTNKYLSGKELDDINKNLSRMRFIRQYSQIKPLLRKNRPEDYIPDEEKRKECFRMTARLFFFVLWSRYSFAVSTENVVSMPFVNQEGLNTSRSLNNIQDNAYGKSLSEKQHLDKNEVEMEATLSMGSESKDEGLVKEREPDFCQIQNGIKKKNCVQDNSSCLPCPSFTPENNTFSLSERTLGARADKLKSIFDTSSTEHLTAPFHCLNYQPQQNTVRGCYPRCRVSKRNTVCLSDSPNSPSSLSDTL
ncbi:uncharacterized protein LOC128883208 [Hylaeus volcanicus]|uniref:uncharacterized protein LOC128883208 n=1 Tax=Hylaeus volcanicus TaxID=313075 RepID=UPI0023B8593F|nr:uncharacterized protein LOC128883208 [Hylaeus volcanicus]